MNLYIYKYNNYYNRIFKKAGDSIEDYAEYEIYGPVQGVTGFTPGDGVNTKQVIGSGISSYNGEGDYLIVQNNQTNEIESRWFIIDHNRTRSGQWELVLHRDLIADFYDDVVDAPMFIEKATLPSDSPLIFNNEQMTVNQIKTPYNRAKNELLVQDRSKCAWLVGYYARKSENETTTLSGSIPDPDIRYDFSVPDITKWEFYKYQTESFVGPSSTYKYEIYTTDDRGYYPSGYDVWYDLFGDRTFECERHYGSFLTNNSSLMQPTATTTDYFNRWITANAVLEQFAGKEIQMQGLANEVIGSKSRNYFDEFQSLNGQIVYDEMTQIYYQITILDEPNLKQEKIFVPSTGGTEANTLFGLMARQCAAAGIEGTANASSFAILNVDVPRKKLSIVAINESGYDYTISTSRRHLTDAPYDMFCIPYSDTFSIYDGSALRCVTKKEIGLQVINNMIENYDSIIYDIQILPFCPVPNILKMAGEKEQINVSELSTLDYSWIEQGEDKISAIFNVTQSSWSDYIQLDNADRIQIINAKMQNECDKYRLCSPNFNSAFEFSAAKNNGLNGFNIYCTYYPYNPYIQVAPQFNGLYGQTYNDSRGLVCQGDYSLTIVNNSWTEYQLQNKNYLNSFNREIDNMEVQHKVGRIQDIVGGATGTLGGAASGAMLGSMIPGIGTAVGAIAGGIASAAGGVADYAINEMLRNEALDYKKDQFGYQLDNIKALPFTLSKVSSLTVNNRLFPFIEYYTCTDTEKKALANKIAWNGMTVGVIGTINEYKDNTWSYGDIESKGYIKGKLIRLENINEDFHIVNAISGELDKGVYIK